MCLVAIYAGFWAPQQWQFIISIKKPFEGLFSAWRAQVWGHPGGSWGVLCLFFNNIYFIFPWSHVSINVLEIRFGDDFRPTKDSDHFMQRHISPSFSSLWIIHPAPTPPRSICSLSASPSFLSPQAVNWSLRIFYVQFYLLNFFSRILHSFAVRLNLGLWYHKKLKKKIFFYQRRKNTVTGVGDLGAAERMAFWDFREVP